MKNNFQTSVIIASLIKIAIRNLCFEVSEIFYTRQTADDYARQKFRRMIMQRTFRSRSAELGPWTILFSTSSGCASAYAAPNRTSALYRVLFWMIYRRDAFVAASSISALPPFFFYVLPTQRIESDALDHRQRLSSLRSLRHVRLSSRHPLLPLSLRSSLTPYRHFISPSDKPLSLPLFNTPPARSGPIDCTFRHSVLKRGRKQRVDTGGSERTEGNDKFAKGKRG